MAKTILGYGARVLREAVAAPTRYLLGTITHVSTEQPIAALTFDDGPHPEYTPRLLEILERYRAHATFFMVGRAASQHQDLICRMAKAGHTVANHSWDHACFPLIPSSERRAQISACEKAIAPYGNRFFRPPYGAQNVVSRLEALQMGYKVITWNVDAGDWWEPDARRMADRLAQQLRPGSIAVFHDALFDGGNPSHELKLAQQPKVSREPMLEALEIFLKRSGDKWSFVTIPDLLRYGIPQYENWYRRTGAG